MLSLLIALSFLSPAHACQDKAQAAPKPKLLASNKMVKGSLPAKTKSYGTGVTLKEKPLSLTEAVARREELKDKDILIRAEVGQVCQSKGCWIVLKDGDQQVRVSFKDYAFFVPKDSAHREALVQGRIFEKDLTAAEARHYAKDAGMPEAEVKKMQASAKTPWIEATGLTLTQI